MVGGGGAEGGHAEGHQGAPRTHGTAALARCWILGCIASDANILSNQREEKEQRARAAKQQAQDELEAKKEADRIFAERQQSKARQIKDDRRELQDFNATLMVALTLPCDIKLNLVVYLSVPKPRLRKAPNVSSSGKKSRRWKR